MNEFLDTVQHAVGKNHSSCVVQAYSKPTSSTKERHQVIVSVHHAYAVFRIKRNRCLQELSDRVVRSLERYVMPLNKRKKRIPSWIAAHRLGTSRHDDHHQLLIERYGSANVFENYRPHVVVGYNRVTSAIKRQRALDEHMMFDVLEPCEAQLMTVQVSLTPSKRGGAGLSFVVAQKHSTTPLREIPLAYQEILNISTTATNISANNNGTKTKTTISQKITDT